MISTTRVMTAERFARGMTFDDYVAYAGSPGNLKREASRDAARRDWSGFLRKAYDAAHLTEAQEQGWRWLVGQPEGPAKILVLSEEWSSDCRRDVPTFAKIADMAGLELRIFPRDGQRVSRSPEPDPNESANADLMAQFLNRRDGQTFQSIPVIAFYTRDFRYLYHYTEFPAVYRKDRLVAAIHAPRPGETKEETQARGDREFMDMLGSPFFHVWAGAAVDETLSFLYERLRVGSLG